MTLREYFTTAFIREFTYWQRWRSHAVVIGFAVLAGAIIATFTWLAEHALALFFN